MLFLLCFVFVVVVLAGNITYFTDKFYTQHKHCCNESRTSTQPYKEWVRMKGIK